MTVRPHQPFGDGIRRRIGRPKHPRRVSQQPGFVAADQDTERFDIAAEDTRDDVRI